MTKKPRLKKDKKDNKFLKAISEICKKCSKNAFSNLNKSKKPRNLDNVLSEKVDLWKVDLWKNIEEKCSKD